MKRYLKAMTLATAMIASAAAPGKSAVLTVGGGWTEFTFGGAGTSWSDSFTFALAGSATLRVTDAFLSGDRFEVFINGVSQGQTSAPGSTGDDSGADYDLAFASPNWSHAAFVLDQGNYTVTGLTTLSPFGGGGAGIELVAPGVPEPSTWALMIAGLVGLGLTARRGRKPVAIG